MESKKLEAKQLENEVSSVTEKGPDETDAEADASYNSPRFSVKELS